MIQTIIQNLNVDLSNILLNWGILSLFTLVFCSLIGIIFHRPSGKKLISSSQFWLILIGALIADAIYAFIVPAIIFAGVP